MTVMGTDEKWARAALALGILVAATFPRSGSTEITQADFPAIIEAVRQKVFAVLDFSVFLQTIVVSGLNHHPRWP
jgi:hypothetical protein